MGSGPTILTMSRGGPRLEIVDIAGPGPKRFRRALVTVTVGVAVLALLVPLALLLLVDWRVRLHTLVKLDPAPGPVTVQMGAVQLTVTGALLRDRAPDGTVVLR